jgi:hypothetical protein
MCVPLGSPRLTEANPNPFKLLAIETNATIDDVYVAYEHKKDLYGVANGGNEQDVAKITKAYCEIHEAKLGAKSPLGETWFESIVTWIEMSIRGTVNAAGILALVLAAMNNKLSFDATSDQSCASLMLAMMCWNPVLGESIGLSERPRVHSAANATSNAKASIVESNDTVPGPTLRGDSSNQPSTPTKARGDSADQPSTPTKATSIDGDEHTRRALQVTNYAMDTSTLFAAVEECIVESGVGVLNEGRGSEFPEGIASGGYRSSATFDCPISQASDQFLNFSTWLSMCLHCPL